MSTSMTRGNASTKIRIRHGIISAYRRELLYRLKSVGLIGRFVRPVTLDACETQRKAARIPRAHLNFVESDLHHELGLHVHGVAVACDFDLQQLLGLPFQHFVS